MAIFMVCYDLEGEDKEYGPLWKVLQNEWEGVRVQKSCFLVNLKTNSAKKVCETLEEILEEHLKENDEILVLKTSCSGICFNQTDQEVIDWLEDNCRS